MNAIRLLLDLIRNIDSDLLHMTMGILVVVLRQYEAYWLISIPVLALLFHHGHKVRQLRIHWHARRKKSGCDDTGRSDLPIIHCWEK